MKRYKLIFLLITVMLSLPAFAQPYKLELKVKNLPGNHIVLGKVSGDDFQIMDTILVFLDKNNSIIPTKKAEYTFPGDSKPGIYRLILGKTTYAKVMDEPPQQLDFIFRDENIILETDFKKPEENLLVVLSEENRVWFEFLQREKEFQEKLDELEMELDYYREKETGVSRETPPEESSGNAVNNQADQYNELQQQRDEFIIEITARNPALFATKLIKMYRDPFLDGNLSKEKRREKFQQEYFGLLDFSDETLIKSAVYTDKIFDYLTSYNRPGFTKEQLEQEYIKAVDIVLANTGQNREVREFVLDYLVHGFEVLEMENVLNYVAENYSESICQTDEKTTLQRKLESQKMKPGTIVPDFTLPDMEGFFVTLSEIQKEKTLLLFWASWCPHCRQMIPSVKTWASGKNDLQVVAVSLDTSKTEWQSAVKELGIESWINLSDLKKWEGEVATDYNIYATPTMFLIDKERKILAKPVTVQDLQKK